MNRSELKNKAKEILKGNIWNLFLAIFIVCIIEVLIQNIPSILGIKTTVTSITKINGIDMTITRNTTFGSIWQIIYNITALVLNLGLVNYFLKFIRGQNPEYIDIFNIIKHKINIVLPVAILTTIFIYLGFICLIIPGIIVLLGLSLCNYILVDEDITNPMDILKKSYEMMQGHKFELFILELSFIGWYLLCIFILPLIYVIPYINLTMALYYEKLRKEIKE